MEKKNIIVEKCLEFSVEIIRYCEELEKARKYVVANQLIRCGTGIGSNVFEAQYAESWKDFVHKMKIAQKEAGETLYWLIICERVGSYPVSISLKSGLEEIMNILSKIIITTNNRYR